MLRRVQFCKCVKVHLNVQKRKLSKLLDIDSPIIPLNESRRFMQECMQAVGTPFDHAQILAENLSAADYRGHYSHGMNRLEMYVNDVKANTTDCKAKPKILKETVSTAWVDAMNGLGAVSGKLCMELAIAKAKETGIGWVTSKNGNHYGIAGYYTLMAVEEGLLGMSFTNTSPLMAPTRAKKAALGTNPLSLGAPVEDKKDSFMLDMATTVVAVGKIEMQKRKNKPIPDGWALGKDGKPTTDAVEAYDNSVLMPLGGTELNSGYKGAGLGMLVEIFCGILSGSNYGPKIRRWGTSHEIALLGHCFVAINPEMFAPGFEDRMADLMKIVRTMEPAEKELPVLVAGDPEREHMKAVDEAGGVRYVQQQLDSCAKLAKSLKVAPLKPLSSK